MRENELEQTSYPHSKENQIRFLFFVLERIKNSKNTAKVQRSLTEPSDIVTKEDEHDKKIIEKIKTGFHPLLN